MFRDSRCVLAVDIFRDVFGSEVLRREWSTGDGRLMAVVGRPLPEGRIAVRIKQQ